jgi:ABC-type lipoprotein export system ATPase subunit
MQLFRALHAEGRTIVMVTHNPDIAAELPRVVEMQDGRIVRDGPPVARTAPAAPALTGPVGAAP